MPRRGQPRTNRGQGFYTENWLPNGPSTFRNLVKRNLPCLFLLEKTENFYAKKWEGHFIENQQKLLLCWFTGGFFVDFWIYKGAIPTKSGSGLFKQKTLGFSIYNPCIYPLTSSCKNQTTWIILPLKSFFADSTYAVCIFMSKSWGHARFLVINCAATQRFLVNVVRLVIKSVAELAENRFYVEMYRKYAVWVQKCN